MKNYYSAIKRGSKNIRGLVTSHQAKMANSIMNKTTKTDKSTRQGTQHTQKTIQGKEFDEFEDVFEDIEDTLFINYEEERKIHQILQFARKGKINQNNAFEIPVKVINPEFAQNNNLRFWKFASELLSASMCIYDKRVQNMFQTTNKVFDHLVRAKNNDQTESNPEETYYIKSRRKKEELMRMQIAEMGNSKNIKFLQIGELNRQIPQKLSIRNESQQFNKSPLFQKVLKAFDSNQLKNLFLNIFEPSNTLEITFFHDNVGLQNTKQEKLQQLKQSFQQQEIVPAFVEQQLKGMNCIISQQIYHHISRHLGQGVAEIGQRSHYLHFQNDFSCFKLKQSDPYNKLNEQMTQLNDASSLNGSNFQKFSFNFVTNEDIGKCLSEELNHSNENYYSNHQCISEKLSRQVLQIQENQYSIMMPEQLEFKGLKLFQKNLKAIARQRKKTQKNKQGEGLQINLQFQVPQNRQDVLRAAKFDQQKLFRRRKYLDKFLLAKAMDPFLEIHRIRGKMKKGMKLHHHLQSEKKTDNGLIANQQQQTLFQNHISTLQNIQSNKMASSVSYEQTAIANISTEGLNNLRTFGLRSIRQIKQDVYNRLQIRKQLKLSQVDVPISPSSTFLIFLHLINENQLQIESIEHQQDVILYYNES